MIRCIKHCPSAFYDKNTYVCALSPHRYRDISSSSKTGSSSQSMLHWLAPTSYGSSYCWFILQLCYSIFLLERLSSPTFHNMELSLLLSSSAVYVLISAEWLSYTVGVSALLHLEDVCGNKLQTLKWFYTCDKESEHIRRRLCSHDYDLCVFCALSVLLMCERFGTTSASGHFLNLVESEGSGCVQ